MSNASRTICGLSSLAAVVNTCAGMWMCGAGALEWGLEPVHASRAALGWQHVLGLQLHDDDLLCWPDMAGPLRCNPAKEENLSNSPPPPSRGRTMNMDFHPDLTLATRASTIWLTQRMMSSRISSARLCRITTTNGRRKSFWSRGR